jgi:hypothetical protein
MANAQLWALKVEEDCRGPVKFLFERPDRAHELRFLFLVAVAHVDAERIRADEHELADRLGVARRWAERREYLYLARAGRESFGHWHVSLIGA